MPKLIQNEEEFEQIVNKAKECRIVRRNEIVKIKLRTPKQLYIFITNNEKAQNILKKIKIDTKEF